MSIGIQIENLPQVRADISARGGDITEREGRAVGAEVSRLVQRHLRDRDSTNAHDWPDGGRRSHYWAKAAQAVSWELQYDGIAIHITQLGVRLHYKGAPNGIQPVNRSSLAIPANALSYGKLPSDFAGLRVVPFKRSGRAALVLRTPASGLLILFWLVKHTKPIDPDPTVLPPDNVIVGLACHRLAVVRGLEK